MRTRTAATIAACLLAVACGSGTGEDTTTPDADGGGTTAAAAVLTIADFAFGDVPTVETGEEILVRNEDEAVHTVTATDGSFNVRLEGGERETFAVDEAGTYDFSCTIHPSMSATLTVEG